MPAVVDDSVSGADVSGGARPDATGGEDRTPHDGVVQEQTVQDQAVKDQAARPGSGVGLPRSVVVLIGGAALVVVLAGVQQLQSLIGPAFLAFTLVLIITPAQQWLLRHRVPGFVVITGSVVVLYAVILGLLAALALSIAALIRVLPSYVGTFETYFQDAQDQLARIGVSGQLISQAASQVSPSSIFGFATTFLQSLLSGLTSVTTVVVLLAVIVLFLVVDALSSPQRVEAAKQSHGPLMEAMLGFTAGVRRYWLITTVFGAIVAALDVAALLVIGVPLALTWGLLAFITNYIPNVGFVLGLVPPALIAVLEGGLSDGILVVVVYSVLNVVIQTVIQPRFTGDAVGLTATVAFLSLLFWAVVLGPLGALLAIPATSFVKAVLVDADPSARWINAFVASDYARAPEQQRGRRRSSGGDARRSDADGTDLSDEATVDEAPVAEGAGPPADPSDETKNALPA